MCTGYHRERIFVALHGSAKESLKTSAQKHPSSTAAEPSSAYRKNDDASKAVPYGLSKRPSVACCTQIQQPLNQDVSVRHAFRQQLISHYIYSHVPENWSVVQQPLQKARASWLMLITELPEVPEALEASIIAMTSARIGRLNDDPTLVKASLKSYVQGLWELQKALWDPDLMYRDETLAACMALWIYEVMECPDETATGWISHFDGCQRLIKLRGAEAHATGLGHEVFVGYRTTAVSPLTYPSCQGLCKSESHNDDVGVWCRFTRSSNPVSHLT